MKRLALGCASWYVLGPLLWLGIGVTMLPLIRNAPEALASLTWPSTTAVIETSGVEEGTVVDPELGRQRSWTVALTYRYTVGGQEYFANRVGVVKRAYGADLARAQATAALYRPGEGVAVYYDPSRPERAVLERGYPLSWKLWLTSWSLAGAAGVFVLGRAAWRRWQERPVG